MCFSVNETIIHSTRIKHKLQNMRSSSVYFFQYCKIKIEYILNKKNKLHKNIKHKNLADFFVEKVHHLSLTSLTEM